MLLEQRVSTLPDSPCLTPQSALSCEHTPVDQAVGELLKKLVGWVLWAHDEFAHRQRLSSGGGHHVAQAGVDEHLVFLQTDERRTGC